MILQKGMLVTEILDGPHDRNIDTIRVINRVSWRMNKAAHSHIWRVTVSNDRANFVIEVPDSLAADTLADNVKIGDQWKLIKHLGSVMDLVTLINISLTDIYVV